MPGWGARCWLVMGPLLSLACAVDFDRHFVGADPDCVCAPQAPAGWEGPIALASVAETCEESARTDVDWCGPCACDDEGASCGAGELTFAEPGCAVAGEIAATGTGDCVELGVSGGLESVRGAPGQVNQGCSPSGGGRSQIHFCALLMTPDCSDAELCAPQGATVCVHRVGEWPCDAPFVEQSFFGTEPATACEPCACEPGAENCVGVTTLFLSDACTGDGQTVTHDGSTCTTLTETPSSARHELGGVTCQPTGGRPQGAEVGTLCCIP